MRLLPTLIEKAVKHVNLKNWWHVPPVDAEAYRKRGKFLASSFAAAEFYGRPLDEPQRVSIANPLIGDEKTISKALGIPPQYEGMTLKQIAAHDALWRNAPLKKGFDSILLMAPKCFTEFKASGKIPRSLELNILNARRPRLGLVMASSNKRDAEALFALRKSEIVRGVFRRPAKITFDKFGDRYMEHAKANKRSWLRDEQMYRKLKEFFGSERQLTDFNPADIEGYKLHRRKEVSGSTVNRELALLKRMFNLAIDWELLRDLNPVRKVKFFKELNTGTRVLSPEEEESLIRNAAPYIQDLIRFALNTGLRTGEIFILRWSNVDFEKNLLNVFAPKTQKTRAVPINSDARKVLEAWALGRKNEFVFYNFETGKPFVDLKSGFGLVSRGVDIVTVQQLLGHSTLTVTMRYTHTNLDSKHAAGCEARSVW